MTSTARFRHVIRFLVLQSALAAMAFGQATSPPVILFSDLASGPATGNSDTSQSGQVAGQDGAIVTVWGKYLGTSPGTITVGGLPARIYSWGNATGPADLYTRHKMQMVSFQVPHGVSNGATTIQATVGGVASNTLPFTVRSGNIYFVSTTGNDSAAGTWSAPWRNLYANTANMQPGDTVYILNGYTQTGAHDGGGCSSPGCTMSLEYGESSSQFATQAMPKAVIGYPGATASIGDTSVDAWGTYNGGSNPSAAYWTFSKLNLIGASGAATYSMGHRLIGNHISCPNGDGQTGCIGGDDSTNLYVLGNELTNCGSAGTSKLYHPMYIQSMESGTAPRLPDENNREIGWNYLHDNYAYDGINLYRENTYSAFMLNTRVHDNFIVNQTGRGMLIGSYVVGPDNYFYNNVVISAGKGPDSKYTSDPAFNYQCVYFNAGWSGYPGTTTIHFYNNTLYDCGWNDPGNASSDRAMLAFDNSNPFTLDFRNNIVLATSWPYETGGFPTGAGTKNVWYGQGASPSWDSTGISANPLLVSPGPPNFNAHLSSGSPAIGAGSTIAPSVSIDFDNLLRPSPPSIGAFEFSGASAPPPAADTTAPSVPAGFFATAVSSTQVNLSWTASTDPDNSATQIAYTVYRNGTQVANTAAGSTSYSDSGLTTATTYTYTVAAFDPAGNTSAQSPQVFVTTQSNPVPVPVISSFTATPSSITAGGSSTLSWSVSAATSLSISGIGTVIGTSISVSPAQTTTYTLTATNSAGSTTAQTTVTVNAASVVSIAVAPAKITLGPGQQQPLTATVTGTTNISVTWSSNPAIGSLSSAGLYTAPAMVSGTLTIAVKATSVADPNKSASATITLQPPAKGVSISVYPSAVNLREGRRRQFRAFVRGATDMKVTWSISPALGKISSTGLYTAPATIDADQTVTVTATSKADPTKSAHATVHLIPPTSPAGIQISKFGAFDITANSASVSWDTNVATTGQVQYGTTTAYGQSVPLTVHQWSHTVTLTGLAPGTVYHYRIQAWTNLASGVASTVDLTFSTLGQ